MSGFGNSVVAGTNLVREAINSPNYVAGSAGWSVNKNGSAEFNNVTVRGDFEVVSPTGSHVDIHLNGNIAQIDIAGGRNSDPTVESFSYDGAIYADIGDFGTSSYADLIIASPGYFPANDASIVLTSQPYDGSGTSQIQMGNNSNPNPTALCRIWLDGNVYNRYVTDAGNGLYVGTGSSSNSAGALATETVVLTIPATTYYAGRAYRITVNGSVQTTLANQTPQFRIRKTNTAGTVIDTWRVPVISTNSHGTSWTTYFYVTGSNVFAAIVLTLTGSAGFTATLTGAAGAPSSMQIWDHSEAASVSAWALQLT